MFLGVCSWTHLDVPNQELCWRFHWCFSIYDFLDGTCPVNGLIEVLGVQPVAVLPPIYCDAPVAWKKQTTTHFICQGIPNCTSSDSVIPANREENRECSLHGTPRMSGVTLPLADFLSRFRRVAKVSQRGTSDHAKTKQEQLFYRWLRHKC